MAFKGMLPSGTFQRESTVICTVISKCLASTLKSAKEMGETRFDILPNLCKTFSFRHAVNIKKKKKCEIIFFLHGHL